MPIVVTETDAFTSPLRVPAAAEPLTAASLLRAIQPLADRTRRLLNIAAGDQSVPEPRRRTLRIDAHRFTVSDGLEQQVELILPGVAGAVLSSNIGEPGALKGDLTTAGNIWEYPQLVTGTDATLFYSLNERIPQGGLITSVDAVVDPGSTNPMRMSLVDKAPSDYATPPSFGAVDEVVRVSSDGTASRQVLRSGRLAIRNRLRHALYVAISASPGASAVRPDRVDELRITYRGWLPDVRPRHALFFDGGQLELRAPVDAPARAASAVLNLHRLLPRGARIERIRVLVKPDAARPVGFRMNALVWRNPSRSWHLADTGRLETVVGPVEDDGVADQPQTLELQPDYVVAAEPVHLVVNSGSRDFAIDRLYGADITFWDPGPRND